MAVTVLLLQVPGLDGPGHLPQWGSPAATVLRAFPTGSRFCLLGSGHQDSEACGYRNENTAQGLTEFRGVRGLLAQAPLSRVAVPFPVGDSAGQGDLHIEKAGPLTNGWRFQAAHEVRERGGPLGAQGPCCGAEGCAQSPRGGPATRVVHDTAPAAWRPGGTEQSQEGAPPDCCRLARAQIGTRLPLVPAPARSQALPCLRLQTHQRGRNSRRAGRLREAQARGLSPRPGMPTGRGRPCSPAPAAQPLQTPPLSPLTRRGAGSAVPCFPGGTGGPAPGGLLPPACCPA